MQSQTRAESGEGELYSNTAKILLVEDTPGDILLIRRALAEAPFPIQVQLAMDGEQALQILSDREFRPDLVILDLNIPKLSGLAVLARCRIEAPVVVFTSSSSVEDQLRSFELGAKEYVQKPIDLAGFERQVSQMVRNWIRAKDRAAGASG